MVKNNYASSREKGQSYKAVEHGDSEARPLVSDLRLHPQEPCDHEKVTSPLSAEIPFSLKEDTGISREYCRFSSTPSQ